MSEYLPPSTQRERGVTAHEELGDVHSGPGLSLDGRPVAGPLKLKWASAFSSLALDGRTGWKLQMDELSCRFLATGSCYLQECEGSQSQLSGKGQ